MSRTEIIWHLAPLILPAALIINALYVFARFGRGTAFPYDPPRHLVTQGVYGYISNPMQLGICLMMAWWSVVLQNLLVFGSAFVALFLFIVFKSICNGSSSVCGKDPEWEKYQNEVPKWFPKFSSL